jgi:hypothetical protein
MWCDCDSNWKYYCWKLPKTLAQWRRKQQFFSREKRQSDSDLISLEGAPTLHSRETDALAKSTVVVVVVAVVVAVVGCAQQHLTFVNSDPLVRSKYVFVFVVQIYLG